MANLLRGRDAKPAVAGEVAGPQFEVLTAVKANLARFTYALMVLGTLVLSLGAGKRW